VEVLSDAENDAYFRSRPWQSRIGAWASQQSEPVQSRAVLGSAVAAAAHRFGVAYNGPGTEEPKHVRVEVPRPPHWGGFRLNVDAVELWVEGEFRIHDRARWTRISDLRQDVDAATTWSVTRLQP
jgi:pyridoxamine 5'-phosphate oxidase